MNNLWAMDPSLIETFISGMITVPGLDADGKKQAQQIVKDYYFKNGRFERQHNDNVTNVSISSIPFATRNHHSTKASQELTQIAIHSYPT